MERSWSNGIHSKIWPFCYSPLCKMFKNGHTFYSLKSSHFSNYMYFSYFFKEKSTDGCTDNKYCTCHIYTSVSNGWIQWISLPNSAILGNSTFNLLSPLQMFENNHIVSYLKTILCPILDTYSIFFSFFFGIKKRENGFQGHKYYIYTMFSFGPINHFQNWPFLAILPY